MDIAWNEIKQNIPIHVILRKHGIPAPARESYRIPCPLHGGRDANFSVSERAGLWNCFSVCHRGGSVIDLVAALEKITPKEAAMKLSADYHLTPDQESIVLARAISNKVERWKALNKVETVEKIPETISLQEGYRGLKAKTIQHWGLARSADGVYIPLFDGRGQICGYSIRRFDARPKYENAHGIGKYLPFGLFQNKADIIREGFVWVVEGQFDAITLWQKGYKNVVALMGSALSEQQAMSLLTLTSNLELCLDGDDAGRLAAAKIRKAWGSVFDIGEFVLPEGVDPDQYEGILEREKHDMARTDRIRTTDFSGSLRPI